MNMVNLVVEVKWCHRGKVMPVWEGNRGCRYSMSSLKYMWMDGSRWLDDAGGFFAALIIYNTPNGIDGVEMFDNGEWCAL